MYILSPLLEKVIGTLRHVDLQFAIGRRVEFFADHCLENGFQRCVKRTHTDFRQRVRVVDETASLLEKKISGPSLKFFDRVLRDGHSST